MSAGFPAASGDRLDSEASWTGRAPGNAKRAVLLSLDRLLLFMRKHPFMRCGELAAALA